LDLDLKSSDSNNYYEKNGYILVFDFGVWKICSNKSGQLLMTNLYIENLDELHRHYEKTTGENLE
jgi:hypothetical protein